LAVGVPDGGAAPPAGAGSWRAAHDAAVTATRLRADALGQRLRGTYEAAAALKASRKIQARRQQRGAEACPRLHPAANNSRDFPANNNLR
jgi:hypothetical protein